jgi:hypothetical protein
VNDFFKIQDDLNRFSEWCRSNGLKLNTSIYIKIPFSRSKNKLNSVYNFFEENVKKITYIRDHGVMFQTNLLFVTRIDYISMKVLKCLGFITRNTKDFKKEQCLKTL